jgi:hypothetical protein
MPLVEDCLVITPQEVQVFHLLHLRVVESVLVPSEVAMLTVPQVLVLSLLLLASLPDLTLLVAWATSH